MALFAIGEPICEHLCYLWLNRRGKELNTERHPQMYTINADDRCAVFLLVMVGGWWAHRSVQTNAEGIIDSSCTSVDEPSRQGTEH